MSWIAPLVLAVAGLVAGAASEPWDLHSYELCRHERLDGIPNEASGVTYSAVTNSLWVITRRPSAVMEYGLDGKKLRQVSHRGLRDPEGITWMYGYTFAVAQEGGGQAAIVIMNVLPWERSVDVLRKLVLPEVRCRSNFCFEGVTYDMYKNVFYAVQEMDPMSVWMVTPSGKGTKILREQTKFPGMRDLAGIYYMAQEDRLFVLSQTEQKVAELTWDGEIVDGQIIPVRDNVVEGLTFTPDGHLMFNVGEPNDLWVYTVTGDCDWKPEPWMIQQEPKIIIGSDDIPDVSEDTEGGYCNFNNCKGGRQGNTWCNANYRNCAAGCGATWCWYDSIGLPITSDNLPYVAPTPAPTPRPGFCTWDSCAGGAKGRDVWCDTSSYSCAVVCNGRWCFDDGSDESLTATDFPPRPPAPWPRR